MCFECIKRSMKSTPISSVYGCQFVYHPHCSAPECAMGHVHWRFKFADDSFSEWTQTNGNRENMLEGFRWKFGSGLQCHEFEEMYEAELMGMRENVMSSLMSKEVQKVLRLESKNHLKIDKDDEEEICPICFSPLDKDSSSTLRLPCQHKFCESCFMSWAKKHVNCPICRVDVTAELVEQAKGRGVGRSTPSLSLFPTNIGDKHSAGITVTGRKAVKHSRSCVIS